MAGISRLPRMGKWYDIPAMTSDISALHISKSPDAQVVDLGSGCIRLEIPARSKRGYRIAQLDDHRMGRRRDFRWKPPLTMSLQARVSTQDLPGTWGFGFWNDPFSFLLGSEGAINRFPTLPDAAWFFHASPQNYLSFRNDLPANGFLAATFKSTRIPVLLLALVSPGLLLTLLPGTAQLVRKALRRVIQQDATLIRTDETAWHTYNIVWDTDQVSFRLDGMEILRTMIAPHAPLSLVMWVDNQYAALPPRGGMRYGTLTNPQPAWLELRDFSIQQ